MKKLSASKLIGFLVGSVPSIPKELCQVTQNIIFVSNIKFLYTNTRFLNVKLLSANVKF